MAFCKDFDSMKKNFESVLGEFDAASAEQVRTSHSFVHSITHLLIDDRQFAEPVNVLYVGFSWPQPPRLPGDDQITQYLRTFIKVPIAL